MNWQEFNDLVRVHLIVDSERKGRGIQENIDTLITTAVIDLQRYVPQIRNNQYKFYSNSSLIEPDVDISACQAESINGYYPLYRTESCANDAGNGTSHTHTFNSITYYMPNGVQMWHGDHDGNLTNVNSEDVNVHKGVFPTDGVRIKQVVIRRIATDDNRQALSKYYYPKIIPWESRFDLVDGGVPERTTGLPGRITFGENKFWMGPKLRNDEALYIYFEGEYRPTPIHRATDDEKNAPVIFDEMEAKAVALYVKSFLSLSVDNDINQYQLYTGMYQKDRAQIHINRKSYKAASIEQVASGVGSGGFVIS